MLTHRDSMPAEELWDLYQKGLLHLLPVINILLLTDHIPCDAEICHTPKKTNFLISINNQDRI